MNVSPRLVLCLPMVALLIATPLLAASNEQSQPTLAPATQPDDQAKLYHRWVTDLTSPEMQGRDVGTRGNALARDYIVERFRSAGLAPAFGDSFLQEFQIKLRVRGPATQPASAGPTTRPANAVVTRQVPAHNVVGILPGQGPLAGEAVVIGGHYDHVGQSAKKDALGRLIYFPGADDNASGTAGVMLLARWFAAREPALGDEPRRTIIFAAFSGEERGLLGSAYLASHLPAAPASVSTTQPDGKFKVVAMLNLDMIGRLRNNRLYVQGVESGDHWRDVVSAAAKGMSLDLRMAGGGYGPSDHASFYARGVPVLFFITGGHGDVHQPTDTADKINSAGAVSILRLVDAVARSVRVEAGRIAYIKTSRPTAMPQPGNRAYLGVKPDPIDGGDGCTIDDVMDDGPAAKAGLKAGDVITEWNGKKIAGAAALLGIIATQKPGDVVKLQVRRGSETIELSVTLGQR